MLHVVFDTNLLVSALLSPQSTSAKILDLAFEQRVIPYYNDTMFGEYQEVLSREKFSFTNFAVNKLLNRITEHGICFWYPPITNVPFTDETDRKFYDVAVAADAFLITGNTAHYPPELFILAPNRFLEAYEICCRDNLSRRQFLERYARQEHASDDLSR